MCEGRRSVGGRTEFRRPPLRTCHLDPWADERVDAGTWAEMSARERWAAHVPCRPAPGHPPTVQPTPYPMRSMMPSVFFRDTPSGSLFSSAVRSLSRSCTGFNRSKFAMEYMSQEKAVEARRDPMSGVAVASTPAMLPGAGEARGAERSPAWIQGGARAHAGKDRYEWGRGATRCTPWACWARWGVGVANCAHAAQVPGAWWVPQRQSGATHPQDQPV